MSQRWSEAVARQFGAALEMVGNAIEACPDELWFDPSRKPAFWYVAYHVLFWTDLYLHGRLEGFAPPAPHNLDELDPVGLVPDPPCTQEQMRAYLTHCRARMRQVFGALTNDQVHAPSGIDWIEGERGELQLYNLRHVQHHAGQLQMMLRQAGVEPPRWVKRGVALH